MSHNNNDVFATGNLGAREDEVQQEAVEGMQTSVSLGAERLAGYTDAVLAIIATVLVVPLTKLDESSRREVAGIIAGRSLLEVITSNYQLETLALYYCTFMVVFTVWTRSSYSLNGMHDLDPLAVGASALELLFTCLLPFTAGTAGHAWSVAQDDAAAARSLQIPFYVNLVCVSSSHVLVQLLVSLKRKDFKLSRTLMIEAISDFLITLTALVMKFLYIPFAYLPFLLVPLTASAARYVTIKANQDRMRRIGAQSNTRTHGEARQSLLQQQQQQVSSAVASSSSVSLSQRASPPVSDTDAVELDMSTLFNLDVDRSRLGVFTDGVVAIAVTILVLDVQPPASCELIKDISTCILQHEAGCRLQPITKIRPGKVCYFDAEESTSKLQLLIAAFVLSFLLLNVLRSQHHVVFDQAKGRAVNIPLLALNAQFCFFVSLIPSAFGLVTTYVLLPFEGTESDGSDDQVSSAAVPLNPLLKGGIETSPDKYAGQTALGCVCVVLIASSITLLAMLALRLRSVDKTYGGGEEGGGGKSRRRVWLQFLVMPVVALFDLLLLNLDVPAWICLCVIVAIPVVVLGMDIQEYVSTHAENSPQLHFTREYLNALLSPHAGWRGDENGGGVGGAGANDHQQEERTNGILRGYQTMST